MLPWTFFDSPEQLIIVGLIIFFSQFVYSTAGFGSGMIAISLLTLMYGGLERFLPFFILLCLPTETAVTLKNRHRLKKSAFGGLVIAVLPTLLLGSLLLKHVKGNLLQFLLGLVIAGMALYYLAFEERLKPRFQHPAWLPAAGLVSGFFGSLFGVAGPPLIIYFKARGYTKTDFRLMLLSVFLVMSVFRILFYSMLGLYTARIVFSALVVFPFAAAGLGAGSFLHHRIPDALFRRLTSLILLVSGGCLMIKNLS